MSESETHGEKREKLGSVVCVCEREREREREREEEEILRGFGNENVFGNSRILETLDH